MPRLDEVLTTPGGKVVLAPPYITADLPRLAERLERPADDLVLVSRRHLRSNNSWMHNVPALVKGRTAARCSSTPTTPPVPVWPTATSPGGLRGRAASRWRSR